MSSHQPQGYYAASAPPTPARPALSGDLSVDVCVIGAGFTGLSAALHLAERGMRVAVIEAESVGFGASGRNGGQIHTGLCQTQQELEKWLGPVHARDLWNLTEESKALVHALIAQHAIECELKSGLVIAAHDARAARELAADTEHLATAYNYSAARMMDRQETFTQLGTSVYPTARYDTGGGHLHPLRYARGLAVAAEEAGVAIFEHSKALSLERDRLTVRCAGGNVTADHVILACDVFMASIAPELARTIGHVESFITATAPLPPDLAAQVLPCDAAVADTRHVLDYYRKSADGRLLFAGRESYFSIPADIARVVRPRMLKVFPMLADVPTEFAWSGSVGLTLSRIPHFGRLSDRIYFAHGYSGQGVALTAIAGKLMAEAIGGHSERFDVFARVPVKAIPGGALLRKPFITAALFAYKLMDAV
ncbi:MAG: FAD-binding oxidoreductase [Rhizomicrobium sp.]